MSTIADYSVFTKAFLASGMTDFSQLYGKLFQGEEDEGTLRAFAVIPFNLTPPLTPLEAMNFDRSKLGLISSESNKVSAMPQRVSCQDADGHFIGNIVRVQPGERNGSIRLVAKVAVPDFVTSEGGSNPADAPYNTFVLVRTDASTNINLPIAVATISKGYNLHKHKVVHNVVDQFDVNFVDPLDDVENANYVSFTINNLNGYTSVDFNPDAYATYDDVANALSRGIDGLHIAFDTASGDLKLLDKDGNVLDQANLPIKTDVIIAEGEEGYKYVKTDVKQDIHAAKAWMPKGFTAWETVKEVPYTMQHAALVVDKGSTSASRVFLSEKPIFGSPISTKPVSFEHVVIEGSTYLLVAKTEMSCILRKVKGKAEAELRIQAVISGGRVILNDSSKSYPITNDAVEVDVIEYKGVTYVLVGREDSGLFNAQPISGKQAGQYYDAYSGSIVTFGGSTTASRVFIDPQHGSYPISTESVQLEHVVTEDSTYMVVDKNETETQCNLIKVKGKAEAQTYISNAGILDGKVTLNENQYLIKNALVEVDVIKDKDGVTTYVLVGTDDPGNPDEVLALSIGDIYRVQYRGIIVTSEGSSTGEVLGITPDGINLYTFDENAETPSEVTSISGGKVRWLDIKPLTEVPNHTLKYGLEAFVWTVKDAKAQINEPFFNQLNASLLALGFHEGDDIALGTNLAVLAPAEGGSPLNKVDAGKYMHGKDNKATREQEVNTQRANAKDELVAWNAQHPTLTEDRKHGTIIDSSGLDVRDGRITLGCGRTGEANTFQKVNYGIQMKDHSSDQNIHGRSESLDFTISHTTGEAQFDENGHAKNLTSSTLLSIAAGSYISGAPTCLILAKVSRRPKDASLSEGSPDLLEGSPVLTPVRMTAGFSVAQSYGEPGLELTLHDDRENISAVFVGPNNNTIESSPAIIEVQAIYTHPDASETVPAQQMHTYIGSWVHGNPRSCSFLCNKIEEWMTAIDLTDTSTEPDTNPAENVKLYVVIRVY